MDIEIEDEGVRILERIHAEEEVEQIVKQRLLSKEKDWREEEGLISWQDRIYVPPNCKLRREIIHLHHNTRESAIPVGTKLRNLFSGPMVAQNSYRCQAVCRWL